LQQAHDFTKSGGASYQTKIAHSSFLLTTYRVASSARSRRETAKEVGKAIE
jgi:TfoX/Sxy family transcriptional regulator of competence genes